MALPAEFTPEEIEKRLREHLAYLNHNIEERKEVFKMCGGPIRGFGPDNVDELIALEKGETMNAWTMARDGFLASFPSLGEADSFLAKKDDRPASKGRPCCIFSAVPVEYPGRYVRTAGSGPMAGKPCRAERAVVSAIFFTQ
jgi:hypothetical protein